MANLPSLHPTLTVPPADGDLRLLRLHALRAAWAAYALFIAVNCAAPFNFHTELWPRSAADWNAGFSIRAASTADAILNVAAFAPFGALGWLTLRRMDHSRAGSAFFTLIAGALFSATCEALQMMLPDRVASLADVVANTAGCAAGILIAPLLRGMISEMRRDFGDELRKRPLTLAGQAAACLLLLALWWPCDIVVAPNYVWRAIRHADPDPMAAWRRLPRVADQFSTAGPEFQAAAIRRERAEYALARIAEMAGYALLALICHRALRRDYGFSSTSAAMIAGWVCLFLAALTTGARTFMDSHGLDTLHPAVGLAGAVIGALMAVAVDTGGSATVTRLIQGALAAAVIYVAAYELSPFQFGGAALEQSPEQFRTTHWIPFVGHAAGRPSEALLDLGVKVLRYAVLGMLAAAVLERRRSTSRGTAVSAAFAAMLFCALAQAMHRVIPARHSDVTNVILAVGGAWAGVLAIQYLMLIVRSWPVEESATAPPIEEASAHSMLDWDRKLVDAIVTSEPHAPVLPESALPLAMAAETAAASASDAPAAVVTDTPEATPAVPAETPPPAKRARPRSRKPRASAAGADKPAKPRKARAKQRTSNDDESSGTSDPTRMD